ncbi:MAG: DUF3179 domain-containing protein [Candidatus Sumerlaeia bacterium]|nr:DUF3179 domain-containing protein [Candidatus Sumerlaeia bacterium]
MNAPGMAEKKVGVNEGVHPPWWRRKMSLRESVIYITSSMVLIVGIGSVVYLKLRPIDDFSGGFIPMQMNFLSEEPGPFGISATSSSLIPKDQIFAGGPPKDGIPALTNPKVLPAADAERLQPDDRVIGVVIDGDARAYPLRILNWHEIVNDKLGDKQIAVTYCPLCDSAVVFDREVGSRTFEFGVSGLLYNSNVLMYDRQETELEESLWSQMMLAAVTGPAAEEGLTLDVLPSQLVTWKSWKEVNPDTTALSFDTGYPRNYDASPYEQYFAAGRLMFPVSAIGESPRDFDSFPLMEPVIIILSEDGTPKGYPTSLLGSYIDPNTESVSDFHGGVVYTFAVVDKEKGIYMVTDGEGQPARTVFSFWFEFRAMYPEAEVYTGKSPNRE